MTTLTDFEVAQILSDSLKYVKLYRNHTVVVKYGGNAMKNPECQRQVMHDLVLLQMIGVRIVLVHGGGPAIARSLAAQAIPSQFVDGLRVTDNATMRVVQQVLAGETNKDLVKLLNVEGGRAVGLCGLDANLLTAKQERDDLGWVGHITDVNVDLVEDLLDQGYIPVIASVAGDDEGNSYNVNADTAAAAIAAKLNARRLILMTDINGLMRDVKDPETLISRLKVEEIEGLTKDGVISGGMIPKMACVVDAINGGVERVVLINGTLPHSILVEMLTKGGIGTMVTR
ncbi:MAG: acetylglutamate kinase [Sutterella wadsworthensis]|nr:acetylglutamate kinase [Sutterella wadsworthensis]